MAAKVFLIQAATGVTVYAVVKRLADSFYLNDADGSFAAAPADPYVAFTEDAVALGAYSLSENRTAWSNGLYQIAFYSTAGAPNPAADAPPLDVREVAVLGDAVMDPYHQAGALMTTQTFVLGLLRLAKASGKEIATLAKEARIGKAQASTLEKQQRRP